MPSERQRIASSSFVAMWKNLKQRLRDAGFEYEVPEDQWVLRNDLDKLVCTINTEVLEVWLESRSVDQLCAELSRDCRITV